MGNEGAAAYVEDNARNTLYHDDDDDDNDPTEELYDVDDDDPIESLYDDAVFYGASSSIALNFEEVKHHDKGATFATDASGDRNLASLFRPPFHLLFNGSFEEAKQAASFQDRWLVLNLQSTKEFNSHLLNRDLWANEVVSQTLASNFIFWQVYDDTSEGKKIVTYYELDAVPVVLVIDPVTGQKMRMWRGLIKPEGFLEDLVQFMDNSPKLATLFRNRCPRGSSVTDQQKIKDQTEEFDLQSLTASMENKCTIKLPTYPPLPQEPKGNKNLLCRIGVRFPDGRRVQRNFLPTDPIQLLWSFSYSELGQTEMRSFRLIRAIPGAPKFLDYDSKLTFQESELANCMILVNWDN